MASMLVVGCTSGDGGNETPFTPPTQSGTPTPSPTVTVSPSPTQSVSPSPTVSPGDAPTVTSSSPADGTTAVEPDATISVTFDQDMDQATVNSTNIIIGGPEGPRTGAWAYDAGTRTATFTPDSNLTFMAPYTIRVTTAVTNTGGTGLAAEFNSAFTVRDGAWGTPERIEDFTTGHAMEPKIAIDPQGNAIAVYYVHDGTRYNMYANRYVPGSGWGSPELIENVNTGNATTPRLVMDNNGNATAVFTIRGTYDDLWANRYTAGAGWGTEERLDTEELGHVSYPAIAVDGSGNVMVSWTQNNGPTKNIWYNTYQGPSVGWGTADLLENDAGSADRSYLAYDPTGVAIAVWQQYSGTIVNVLSNRYVPGSGWGVATVIDNEGTYNAWIPKVAVDGSGNAIAVWYQGTFTFHNIVANRYTAGFGWGTPELIENENLGSAWTPEIAMDSAGNAVAVWKQGDGSLDSIYANLYVAGTGWGNAEKIESDDVENAYAPNMAMDAAGNVNVVWYQIALTNRRNAWTTRYVAGTGWGTPSLLETDDTGNAASVTVASNQSGFSIAGWDQRDATNQSSIWVNLFE